MNETVHKRLNEYNWNTAIVKLSAYVVWYCKWKQIRLPAGLEPDDIAMTAIEKVYTGERNWDPVKDPDLFKYLTGTCNSIISNETESPKADVESLNNITEQFYPGTDDYKNEELYCEKLDKEIAAAMRGDPECLLVYKALKDGERPREIAEEYVISIESVRLAQKRIRRTAEKVIEGLA